MRHDVRQVRPNIGTGDKLGGLVSTGRDWHPTRPMLVKSLIKLPLAFSRRFSLYFLLWLLFLSLSISLSLSFGPIFRHCIDCISFIRKIVRSLGSSRKLNAGRRNEKKKTKIDAQLLHSSEETEDAVRRRRICANWLIDAPMKVYIQSHHQSWAGNVSDTTGPPMVYLSCILLDAFVSDATGVIHHRVLTGRRLKSSVSLSFLFPSLFCRSYIS